MEKLKLPTSLLELPDKDRDAIVTVLLQSTALPKEKALPYQTSGDEHNMWERNGYPLLGDAEDELYELLVRAEAKNIGDLIQALGLPLEGLEKAFENDFTVYEDELLKAKDSGRTKMSDYIKQMAKVSKSRIKQFTSWLQNGKAFTREQLKDIDRILSKDLPNYAKTAEAFMVRAGFIGKIRGEEEKQNFTTLGAYIDRVTSEVSLAGKQGATLVLPKKKKAPSYAEPEHKIIEPLTVRELDAVEHASHHAGDKITEISDKHRAGVRQLVIQAKRERWSAQQLASKLFDKFGEHNRDWRRVAITELSFAMNDAYLSGVAEGETVIGMGAVNACKHCQEYVIGKIFTVTHNPPSEDSYKGDMDMVWVGKSNYGRRVAEYRPAIPMHPNCRCRWHRISRFYKLGNNGKLERKSTAELINEERAKRGLAPDKELESLAGLSQEDRLRKLSENLLKNQ